LAVVDVLYIKKTKTGSEDVEEIEEESENAETPEEEYESDKGDESVFEFYEFEGNLECPEFKHLITKVRTVAKMFKRITANNDRL